MSQILLIPLFFLIILSPFIIIFFLFKKLFSLKPTNVGTNDEICKKRNHGSNLFFVFAGFIFSLPILLGVLINLFYVINEEKLSDSYGAGLFVLGIFTTPTSLIILVLGLFFRLYENGKSPTEKMETPPINVDRSITNPENQPKQQTP